MGLIGEAWRILLAATDGKQLLPGHVQEYCRRHVAHWEGEDSNGPVSDTLLLATREVLIRPSGQRAMSEEDQADAWEQMLWDAMSEEDQAEATHAWKKAEFVPCSASDGEKGEAQVLAAEEDAEIGQAMTAFMKKDLKWTHRELHDVLLTVGISVPSAPSKRLHCRSQLLVYVAFWVS